MDAAKLLQLVRESAKGERVDGGQVTLGYLNDILSFLPSEMSCVCDTEVNFGLEPITYSKEPPYSNQYYSHDGYYYAHSKTAYPSCYRGYYCDCTLNASKEYPESNVGHVLEMVREAIGKSFDGYKGGINHFSSGTLVWGGTTSHAETGDYRMIVGVEVIDEKCVIQTKVEED